MERSRAAEKYADIINLPHHTSPNRPQMSMIDRAAQFAPFAALTGHSAALQETARLTERRIELDEGTKEVISEKLQMIQEFLHEEPEVTITYFEPDKKKEGGAYLSLTGIIKKIDEYERRIVMTDGTLIPIEEIYEIESEFFGGYDE